MFVLLHNTAHASKGPISRETSEAVELWVLPPCSCWGKQKLGSSRRDIWVVPPAEQKTQKTRSCSERCRKIQELSSKPMCWITKESTTRCLPSRVSFSTCGFWVAFLLLHSRKRIVATGIAMLMSPKMMRTTVTSVAKSNNGNENDIYGFPSFTR